MRTYALKECFFSLQGEGVRAGLPHVFVRFAGCNLSCTKATHGFDCDTDFDGGQRLGAAQIVSRVQQLDRADCRWVLLTGGEPALQLDAVLVAALHDAGFRIAIETNGTRPLPAGLDWICVSPKTPEHALAVGQANEVKFVLGAGAPLPQTRITAQHYLLSPAFEVRSRTDPDRPGELPEQNLRWCTELCLRNPPWRLSVQQHKLWRVR